MKVQCAWCKKWQPDKPGPPGQVSHTICRECDVQLRKGDTVKMKNPRRYIPPHPRKGSPEAMAWAKRMQAARKAKRRGNPGRDDYDDFYDARGRAKYDYLGIAERIPLHAKKAKQFLQKGDTHNALQHARAVLSLGAQGWIGTKPYRDAEEVMRQVGPGRNPGRYIISCTTGNCKFRKDGLNRRQANREAQQHMDRTHHDVMIEQHNPGARWHEKEARSAELKDYQASTKGKKSLSDFYHGKAIAHRESELQAKHLRMNPGSKVAGVIYNRVVEVRAEKTGSFQPGLYKHPFKKNSHVKMLALDNGDILLHSTSGQKLWSPHK